MNVQTAVAQLAAERPEWIAVLKAAIAVSDRLESYGDEFAGAWVVDELKRSQGRGVWVPNLRLLVSYGLLEKSGESTRGGRRSYYRFPMKQAVKDALARLGPLDDATRPQLHGHRFRFVAAGSSGESGSDVAQRSADIAFEPRPWR
jgi:hypothetical protein